MCQNYRNYNFQICVQLHVQKSNSFILIFKSYSSLSQGAIFQDVSFFQKENVGKREK